jgi:hypothetical protein
MVADIFIAGQQVAYNGCGSSMIDIIVHTFPELLESQNWQTLFTQFIHPMLAQMEKGTTKTVVQGACFCLNKLIVFLIKNHPQSL